MNNSKKPWTKEHDDFILQATQVGMKQFEIGRRIGRSANAVSHRLSELKNGTPIHGSSSAQLAKNLESPRWTDEDDDTIREFILEGASWRDIAPLFSPDRSPHAVAQRYYALKKNTIKPIAKDQTPKNPEAKRAVNDRLTRLIRALDANTAALNRLADDAENNIPIRGNGRDKSVFARLFS